MNRRELLKAAAALPLAPAAFPATALAQNYPSRNITMIVPFPAGGQADLAARPVAAVGARSATPRRRAPSLTATRC